MLIISFDAVGDAEFAVLQKYPAFSGLVKKSALFRNVPSVFVSNTYPVHTSVATGLKPETHGIIANTEPFPVNNPVWNSREAGIRAKTLWQAAAEKGITTAAVFWPVTAYSKTIRYNIPEVLARPGKSQLLTSLQAGSTLLQLRLFLRYRKLLDGVRQPNLDNFACACMTDILKKFNPGLAFIHLTACDFLCHEHGRHHEGTENPALTKAFESLDKNLDALLKAAGDERDIILFSDHSQINVHTVVDPNVILKFRGLLPSSNDGYIPGEHGCYFECCGGSAFLHKGTLPSETVENIRTAIEQSEGFRRFLSPDELLASGYSHAAFGFCAKVGYCYGKPQSGVKANHGYPLDMPDYSVFYIIKGMGIQPGLMDNGSLLDIAPFAAKRMGLNL
ncbi:MAG: ectonucleotide pyrophosphatase/phosphodiesterase [Treponema sp.]|nr:ectonucleotide pyrophosphatase/phosphodiesterase [Treponema sp.]